jgi:hypothetical protein
MSRLCSPLPRTRTTRQAWLWCLAALLLLKAAVPLLAAAAAAHRGMSMAQVCTVYGVRTAPVAAVPAEHGQSDSNGDTLPDHGGAGEHCALASLAGGPLPGVLPAVLQHAPLKALLATPAVFDALPADATLRWLSAQLHAPPVQG